MTCPRIFIEGLQIFDHFCSQWIQMDVSNQFQEIRIFFTNHRFISILKEMAAAFVSFVKRDGISGHKPPHDLAERGRAVINLGSNLDYYNNNKEKHRDQVFILDKFELSNPNTTVRFFEPQRREGRKGFFC